MCVPPKEKTNTTASASNDGSTPLATAVSSDDTAETSQQEGVFKHIPVSSPPQNFTWNDDEEPHAKRRKEILAKYPEIKKLYGHDPTAKYVVLFLVTLQVGTAYYIRDKPWYAYLAAAYIISGTVNHMLLLAMHEIAHNLMAKKPLHNKLIGLFANLPTAVPSCIAFKKYHMEHHRYQGEDHVDVDIPTMTEGKFFNTTIRKFFFVFFQIAFYALRPLIVNPKKPGLWEFINLACCLSFDIMIYKVWGTWAVMYFLLGSLLGGGLHPVAGHFIAEHYVFVEGAETYSYYGPLNIVAFNVGYHNEHHDFPFVAGRNLPKVRAIAKEFYDPLPVCESWWGCIIDYITDRNVNAFSRVKRNCLSEEETLKLNPSVKDVLQKAK